MVKHGEQANATDISFFYLFAFLFLYFLFFFSIIDIGCLFVMVHCVEFLMGDAGVFN